MLDLGPGNGILPTAIEYACAAYTNAALAFSVEGSNDSVNWQTLGAFSNIVWTADFETKTFTF